MGLKVSIDTNVFIAVKNKEPEFEFCQRILDEIELKKVEGIISTIVLAEVLAGFFQNDEKIEAERFSNKALLNFDLISVNQDIAFEAASIRGNYNIKLPDAIIYATTIMSKADFLITNDKRLLKKIKLEQSTPKEFVEQYLD